MKIVTDSSILIDKLRGGEKWDALTKNLDLLDVQLYLPSIVIFELFSGQSSKDPEAQKIIQKIIKQFIIVDLNTKIAKIAGGLFREHTQKLEAPDYIIAATALDLDAQLMTLNHKHFSQVPGLLLV